MNQSDVINSIDKDGYAIVNRVMSPAVVQRCIRSIESMLQHSSVSVQQVAGHVYGARNFLHVLPECAMVHRLAVMDDLLKLVLGTSYGLVRGLYFDKLAGANWSLAWHRDQTIAGRNNAISFPGYVSPTVKHGVPHIQPPDYVLENMLTLRLHLDVCCRENGPLRVRPGTHMSRVGTDPDDVSVLASVGDVLAMRPLLLHKSSASSSIEANVHRRVLQLEYASGALLDGGYAWADFVQ